MTGDLDHRVLLYNSVCLVAVLGDIPVNELQIHHGALFDGVYHRLNSACPHTQLIGRVMAEIVSRLIVNATADSGVLDMKVSEEDPTVRELYSAFFHAQTIRLALTEEGDLARDCYRLGKERSPSSDTNDSANLARPKLDESMAKNDKNRVPRFLADAIAAIKEQHDHRQGRRAEAINVLLDVLHRVGDIELQDLGEELVHTLVSHHHFPHLDDPIRLTAVRTLATLRVPRLMAEQVAEFALTRNMGIADRVDLVTALVRACQVALGKCPLPDELGALLRDAPQCPPKFIALPFMDRLLARSTKKLSYFTDMDGLFGERLLLAMATMMPAVPDVDYARILNGLGGLIGSLLQCSGCPRSVFRASLVLSMAGVSYYPRTAALLPALPFLNTACALVERAGVRPADDIAKAVMGLSAALKEAMAPERLLSELAIEEEQNASSPMHIVY